MKVFLVASALVIVGACANKRHSQRVEDVKNGVEFQQVSTISSYANSITPQELKAHVYEISSDENQGRRTGESGHHRACKYLKDYYIKQQITSPLGGDNYYQHIPESYFSNSIKSSQNVVAFIEGSKFPEEVVIISAHSDHLGITNNKINSGADDNASGTSSILEIAQAFKLAQLNGDGPKRSLLFLHLTGEEEGLYGSRYYIDHPLFAFDKTVCDLNIDMIGRIDKLHKDNPDYVYIIGADRISTELHYVSEAANKTFTNLQLDYKYNAENDPHKYYYRSDHYNFAEKGIPVIFYFNGEHEDYHEASDTADKLNYELLAKRSKLIFTTAWYLANNEQRLKAEKI